MSPAANDTQKLVVTDLADEANVLAKDTHEGSLDKSRESYNSTRCDARQKVYWRRVLARFGLNELSKRQIAWPQKAKRIAINFFLGFHILAITCWSLPLDTPLFQLCRHLVRPYFLWAGLFQSWDTFAPTPRSFNSYVEATVVYKDGSRKIWSLPRMEQLSLSERYCKERYRKFSENLQNEGNDALWPDVARRIARVNSTSAKPVKTIILIQHWSFIVPRDDGSYRPEPWEVHVLLGYGVRPEDLQ
jgi:hypothetical protein